MQGTLILCIYFLPSCVYEHTSHLSTIEALKQYATQMLLCLVHLIVGDELETNLKGGPLFMLAP